MAPNNRLIGGGRGRSGTVGGRSPDASFVLFS